MRQRVDRQQISHNHFGVQLLPGLPRSPLLGALPHLKKACPLMSNHIVSYPLSIVDVIAHCPLLMSIVHCPLLMSIAHCPLSIVDVHMLSIVRVSLVRVRTQEGETRVSRLVSCSLLVHRLVMAMPMVMVIVIVTARFMNTTSAKKRAQNAAKENQVEHEKTLSKLRLLRIVLFILAPHTGSIQGRHRHTVYMFWTKNVFRARRIDL